VTKLKQGFITLIVNLDSRVAKILKAIDKPTKQRIESVINQLTLTTNPQVNPYKVNLLAIGVIVLVIIG